MESFFLSKLCEHALLHSASAQTDESQEPSEAAVWPCLSNEKAQVNREVSVNLVIIIIIIIIIKQLTEWETV